MSPPVPALILNSPHSNVFHMLDPGSTLANVQAKCGQREPDMRIDLLHEAERLHKRACRKCFPEGRIPAHASY